MAELVVQKASITGIAPVFSLADIAGDTFTNYGNSVFHVDNQSASAVTVTIASSLCNFGEAHDIVTSIPAGEERIFGSFDKNRFNDENFKVNVSYDVVTSVNVAVIQY